ncbi:MAG: histidine kinase [Bacteroidia bacterium]
MKRGVLWISVAGFAIIWFCLHLAVLYDEGVSLQQSWSEALTMALTIALFLAGTGFTLRLSKPGISRALTLTLGNLLLAYGSVKVVELFSSEFLERPLYITESTNLPYFFLVLVIFIIFQTFGFFVWFTQLLAERNIELKRRNDEKELIRQAELSELRQQLQPHFLFNSLNSIQALLQFDPQAASMMLQTLADFPRGSVNKTSTQFRSFEEEIRHLRLYLDIEAIRFEDRLKVENADFGK